MRASVPAYADVWHEWMSTVWHLKVSLGLQSVAILRSLLFDLTLSIIACSCARTHTHTHTHIWLFLVFHCLDFRLATFDQMAEMQQVSCGCDLDTTTHAPLTLPTSTHPLPARPPRCPRAAPAGGAPLVLPPAPFPRPRLRARAPLLPTSPLPPLAVPHLQHPHTSPICPISAPLLSPSAFLLSDTRVKQARRPYLLKH